MIVFGQSRIPETLRAPSAPGPHCLPLDQPTLRLWDIIPREDLPPGAGRDAGDQLRAIEAQLLADCGDWNHAAAGFVRAYVAALRDETAVRADALAERAGPLAGLIQPLHWALGAPLPLPRAWPPGPQGDLPAAPVDMAFRVSGRLHVLSLGGGTPRPSQRRFLEGLETGGARLVTLAPSDWQEPGLLARLGPGFADPFDYPGLPRGPFRPRPLESPRPAPHPANQ